MTNAWPTQEASRLLVDWCPYNTEVFYCYYMHVDDAWLQVLRGIQALWHIKFLSSQILRKKHSLQYFLALFIIRIRGYSFWVLLPFLIFLWFFHHHPVQQVHFDTEETGKSVFGRFVLLKKQIGKLRKQFQSGGNYK